MGDPRLEQRVVISGIGLSEVGRRLGRADLDLTVEAARRAIADAGLTNADIDGVVAFPGEWPGTPGFNGPNAWRTKHALNLDLNWHVGSLEGPAQLTGVMNAAMAVATGLCRHVLAYRCTTEATAQGTGGRRATAPADAAGLPGMFFQWTRPFGAVSAANWLAQPYQRYLHETGARREQVGWLAVTQRANAAKNPAAVYRDPITIDDYMAARMITSPLCLYDCDVPADGCVAVIISTADYAPDAPRPVNIEAIGSGLHVKPFWDQWRTPLDFVAADAARHMWSRTDLTVDDIDVAGLYDGFSFLTLMWLEILGFCGVGEAADFVDGGDRISLGGTIPLNTGGGQLSGGRIHGWSHLYEVCTQLRGEAGERQVEGAEVGVVGAGGGPMGGALLLTR
jgi:acetyl-CoA acetyltransferase